MINKHCGDWWLGAKDQRKPQRLARTQCLVYTGPPKSTPQNTERPNVEFSLDDPVSERSRMPGTKYMFWGQKRGLGLVQKGEDETCRRKRDIPMIPHVFPLLIIMMIIHVVHDDITIVHDDHPHVFITCQCSSRTQFPQPPAQWEHVAPSRGSAPRDCIPDHLGQFCTTWINSRSDLGPIGMNLWHAIGQVNSTFCTTNGRILHCKRDPLQADTGSCFGWWDEFLYRL